MSTNNRFDDDIVVDINLQHIVYDPNACEYYNSRIDIFLSDDDIAFHKLRPYDQITCPLPSPLPERYFTSCENNP